MRLQKWTMVTIVSSQNTRL